jgi:hypothetical protein
MDMLSQLVTKADEWSTSAKVVQELMRSEREESGKDKATWLRKLESNMDEHKATMNCWDSRAHSFQTQVHQSQTIKALRKPKPLHN